MLQIDETSFIDNDGTSSQDNTASAPTSAPSSVIAMPVLSGMVLTMHLSKYGYRFKWLNPNWSLKEIVDNFLSPDNRIKLPVSITVSKESLPKIIGRKRMAMTIAENFGPHFDVKTQGVIFSTGTVNSKLCHRVCVGDLDEMQKIFSQTVKTKCPYD